MEVFGKTHQLNDSFTELSHLLIQPFRTLLIDHTEEILTITFNRKKKTNPFNRTMTRELTLCCTELQNLIEGEKIHIKGIILTGGPDKDFSVGGDFNDILALKTPNEVRTYIKEIIDSYLAILSLSVPVVAAVNGYAIGQGYQVALLADWRIGTEQCSFQMPELEHGIACPIGSSLLEIMFGRAQMLSQTISCQPLSTAKSLEINLINTLTSAHELMSESRKITHSLGQYPRTSFEVTKKIQNQRLIQTLMDTAESAYEAHMASFEAKTGNNHFNRILKQTICHD